MATQECTISLAPIYENFDRALATQRERAAVLAPDTAIDMHMTRYDIYEGANGFSRMAACRTALEALDRRGWERSYHQKMFHDQYIRACARVFFKRDPPGTFNRMHQKILEVNGWNSLPQEILISTPRRFGKTISVSMFAAAMMFSCPNFELSIYSTCKRISQKLLRNIIRFLQEIYTDLQLTPHKVIRMNSEEVHIQGNEGASDVRVVNSYPSKHLRRFAETASLDANELHVVVVARVVASFQHIERPKVMRSILASEWGATSSPAAADMDWAAVDTLLGSQLYARQQDEAEFWVRLLSFVDFVDEPPHTDEMEQYLRKVRRGLAVLQKPPYSPLDAIRIALVKTLATTASGAARDEAVAWPLVCRAFVVINVMQEGLADAIAGLLPSVYAADAGVHVAQNLMSFRNPPAEHEEMLVTLATTYMRIRTDELRDILRQADEQATLQASSVQRTFLARQRPSLTKMAERAQQATAHTDAAQHETFAAFVQACRFPLNMSQMMQRYVYFLRAMDDPPRVETMPFVKRVVMCPVMQRNIAATTVVQVDMAAVVAAIALARNVGQPFTALKTFRAVCVDPFMSASRARTALNWSVVLKLYLTAFQRAAVRHACWQQVVQREDHMGWDRACTGEAEQAVELFVRDHAFEAAPALGMLEQAIKSLECSRAAAGGRRI